MARCYLKDVGATRKSISKRNLMFALIFLCLSFFMAFKTLRPAIKSTVEDESRVASTKILNDVIIDVLASKNLKYSEMVEIQKDARGHITAILTDTQKINLLKSVIAKNIEEKLSILKIDKLKIPLGTLLGSDLFWNRGPLINFSILISGNVETNLESNFSGAGLNQTQHRIFMNVTTKVFAFIPPGETIVTTVATNTILTESIIVGEVPDYAVLDSKLPLISPKE